jgi:hypothetical protein
LRSKAGILFSVLYLIAQIAGKGVRSISIARNLWYLFGKR